MLPHASMRLAATAVIPFLAACARAAGPPAPAPQAVPCPRPAAPAFVSTSAAAAPDARPPAAASAFDPVPWLEDLRALEEAMSSHYANLDYALRFRRMDLAALRKKTEARLRAARDDEEAKRAFRYFLNAFGDGHLSIDWSPTRAASPGGADTRPLCARLGYEAHDAGGVDWTQVAGFAHIDDADAADFPGGILALPGGVKLGVLRIALFTGEWHPALCEVARTAVGLADNAPCDDACGSRLGLEVDNRLTKALERRTAAIARAGAQALLVDITGNGGGNDWVQPAVRVLSPVHIEAGVIGAVRHVHWTKDLRERLRSLATCTLPPGDPHKPVVAAAVEKLRAELAEVGTPCDKSALWDEGRPEPTCTQLVRIEPALRYAKPGELRGIDCAEDLYGPGRYDYHEGASSLPLAVLVDGRTASAAEDFAEKLQDQHAALIIGSTTEGAGCGYTNGSIGTVLPRSGARVRIPDCARIRADGTNAVAGVTPDVVLPLLDRDSPYQRAMKVGVGLAGAWPAIAHRRP